MVDSRGSCHGMYDGQRPKDKQSEAPVVDSVCHPSAHAHVSRPWRSVPLLGSTYHTSCYQMAAVMESQGLYSSINLGHFGWYNAENRFEVGDEYCLLCTGGVPQIRL